MTPDMERLTKALIRSGAVHDTLGSLAIDKAEAIVRTVFRELRHISEEAADAGRWPAEDDGPIACLHAILDYILDTKARREAALSDLAQMDGDLL